MDANVTWNGGLSFRAGANSSFSVDLDSDIASGGSDKGFRPMELMLIGMAGCTAMDVISILKKKQQQVNEFVVKAHAERLEEHPKVFTQIIIEYQVKGVNIDRAAVERAVELSENKYCPGIAMLRKTAQIEHKITIED
jgi:putative redox protein